MADDGAESRRAAGGSVRGPPRAARGVAGRRGGAPLKQGLFGMTAAEALVLVAAALLVLAVFVQGGRGILAPRVGVLLLTLAMMAAVAALVHVLAR